jgi:HTH-type transcriptional regulator / antitoxin HipB
MNVYGLGVLLRQAREELGLTQAELSRRSGVSRQLVVKIEQGHSRAEVGKVLALARALGVGLGFEQVPTVPPAVDLDDMLGGR